MDEFQTLIISSRSESSSSSKSDSSVDPDLKKILIFGKISISNNEETNNSTDTDNNMDFNIDENEYKSNEDTKKNESNEIQNKKNTNKREKIQKKRKSIIEEMKHYELLYETLPQLLLQFVYFLFAHFFRDDTSVAIQSSSLIYFSLLFSLLRFIGMLIVFDLQSLQKNQFILTLKSKFFFIADRTITVFYRTLMVLISIRILSISSDSSLYFRQLISINNPIFFPIIYRIFFRNIDLYGFKKGIPIALFSILPPFIFLFQSLSVILLTVIGYFPSRNDLNSHKIPTKNKNQLNEIKFNFSSIWKIMKQFNNQSGILTNYVAPFLDLVIIAVDYINGYYDYDGYCYGEKLNSSWFIDSGFLCDFNAAGYFGGLLIILTIFKFIFLILSFTWFTRKKKRNINTIMEQHDSGKKLENKNDNFINQESDINNDNSNDSISDILSNNFVLENENENQNENNKINNKKNTEKDYNDVEDEDEENNNKKKKNKNKKKKKKTTEKDYNDAEDGDEQNNNEKNNNEDENEGQDEDDNDDENENEEDKNNTEYIKNKIGNDKEIDTVLKISKKNIDNKQQKENLQKQKNDINSEKTDENEIEKEK
ncbi:rad54-like [Anaeramoeba flamelloides]|uniref:Rad54-like n=1 Tax=Anaeramoeba flamelloides TaxID=1746091 RepID=A0AAV7Y1F1_9EUKA|nr:rad54-like [Anaeramoeba flamelloides]